MKLKYYEEFIKESNDDKWSNVWSLETEDIKSLFLYLIDEGWYLDVDFGFERNEDDKRIFTESILPDEEVTPAYFIKIEPKPNVSDVDVTDDFLFGYNTLKDILPNKVSVQDMNGSFKLDDLLLKGGMWLHNRVFGERLNGYISIFINETKKVRFNNKEVCDYYKWSYDGIDENNNVYIDLDIDFLISELFEENFYSTILINDFHSLWDLYEIQYYECDTITLFGYKLDNRNEYLLVESMIKEFGNWNIFKEENQDYKDLNKNFTKDEFIKFVLNERFYKTIESMSKDSEIYEEIKQINAEWEMESHVTENYNEILSNFENKLGEDFNYTKIEKDGDFVYRILFEKKWIDHEDSYSTFPYDNEYLTEFDSVVDVFSDHCNNGIYTKKLNPRLSDYGNVNFKDFNKEIKSILVNYLD